MNVRDAEKPNRISVERKSTDGKPPKKNIFRIFLSSRYLANGWNSGAMAL